VVTTYHIIVTDDTDSVRGIITRIIARTYPSVRISAVADGADALAVFDHEGADLIITNNEMRRMGGLELIREVRSRSGRIPIIMISGDHLARQEAVAAGVTLFVEKPFSTAELIRILQSLLPII